MSPLNNFFSSLTSLDPATLLDAAMILFDIPTKILEQFSVGFRCIQNIGSPVFGFLVGVNNSEHLDEAVLSQVNDSPFGRDLNIRNRTIVRMVRIDQPVGFESGAPMPFQGPDQFQVVDTRIPRIEDDTPRLKLSFSRCP